MAEPLLTKGRKNGESYASAMCWLRIRLSFDIFKISSHMRSSV